MMLTTPCVLLLRWGRGGIQTKDFDVWFRLWARMLMMMPMMIDDDDDNEDDADDDDDAYDDR